MSANKPKGLFLDRDFKAGPGGLTIGRFARWYRRQLITCWKALDMAAIARIARLVENARDQGRQVLVMGNGGSAATASHIAVDLSKTAAVKGKPLLRCISLTDNVPYLTAIGNDLGYNKVFVRQMENLVRKDDVVILVSGSGNSPNILEAAKYAKAQGASTVGLLGFDGGRLKSLVDISFIVHSDQYGIVEDIHLGINHILAFYLKQKP